jgi:hypothetical protein
MPDDYDKCAVRRKSMDRERQRLATERQHRMRGASQRWTQHIKNAILKRKGK